MERIPTPPAVFKRYPLETEASAEKSVAELCDAIKAAYYAHDNDTATDLSLTLVRRCIYTAI